MNGWMDGWTAVCLERYPMLDRDNDDALRLLKISKIVVFTVAVAVVR